jgi:SAM-dependent methyltransferase
MIRGTRVSGTPTFFDDMAEGWASLYSTEPSFKRRYALITQLISETFGKREPGRALDLGCGSGVFSAYLAEVGWHVVAADGSSAMLQAAESHCRSRLGARTDAIEFREMRIDDLNLERESFDVVLCLSTLEYVESDRAALRLICAALRPGGVLLLTVPNRRSVVRFVERYLDRIRRARGSYLRLQRHQYVPREIDATVFSLGLRKERQLFFGVGFSRPRAISIQLERAWWAAMYGAGYVKRPQTR